MSTERERIEVRRRLEERNLLPSRARRLEIEADAQRVARNALHLEGEAARRNEALEAKFRLLAIQAKVDDHWLDENENE